MNGRIEGAADIVDTHYNMVKRWSDRDGDYVYIFTTLNEHINGERIANSEYTGDIAWATRMAKKYGLDISKIKEAK